MVRAESEYVIKRIPNLVGRFCRSTHPNGRVCLKECLVQWLLTMIGGQTIEVTLSF